MIRQVMASWLVLGSVAHGAEYRKITLANGREIPAQIQGITAEAIELQLAQGTMRIAHTDLKNMGAMSAEDYASQPPWRILVLPFKTSAGMESEGMTAKLFTLRVLENIEKVHALTTDDLAETIPSTIRTAIAACGTDLSCAVDNGRQVGVDVVVMGSVEQSSDQNQLMLGAVFTAAPDARVRSELSYTGSIVDHRSQLYARQYEILSLDTPAQPSIPVAAVTKSESPETTDKARTSSNLTPEQFLWAPLPGAPALIRKDYASMGASVAIVGAGTVAVVHMAGHSTWSAPQMTAVSALTSYGLTVAVNHIFGLE